jgi:hypothetical protein
MNAATAADATTTAAAAAAAAASKHAPYNRSIRITAKDASGQVLFTRRSVAPLPIQEYQTMVQKSLIASGHSAWPAEDIRLVDTAGCDLMEDADVQAALDDGVHPLTEITATCRRRQPALSATLAKAASPALLEPVRRSSRNATTSRNCSRRIHSFRLTADGISLLPQPQQTTGAGPRGCATASSQPPAKKSKRKDPTAALLTATKHNVSHDGLQEKGDNGKGRTVRRGCSFSPRFSHLFI